MTADCLQGRSGENTAPIYVKFEGHIVILIVPRTDANLCTPLLAKILREGERKREREREGGREGERGREKERGREGERERGGKKTFLNEHICVGVDHGQRANTHKGFNR